MSDNKIYSESPIVAPYFFRSPYHKKTIFLPFIITQIRHWNRNFLVEVSTVEYKGKKRFELSSGYAVEAIRNLFLRGKLLAKNKVKKSQVLTRDKFLLW